MKYLKQKIRKNITIITTKRRYLLQQQGVQLLLAVGHPALVGAVHHPDQAVGALEVVAPVGAQRLLAAHVPHVHLEAGQQRTEGLRRSTAIAEELKLIWGILDTSQMRRTGCKRVSTQLETQLVSS